MACLVFVDVLFTSKWQRIHLVLTYKYDAQVLHTLTLSKHCHIRSMLHGAKAKTHGGEHGDATMLDLNGAAALEVLCAPILRKSSRIPETNWRLHTQFRLEGPEGRVGVERPITSAAGKSLVCLIATSTNHSFQKPETSGKIKKTQSSKKTENLYFSAAKPITPGRSSQTILEEHALLLLQTSKTTH